MNGKQMILIVGMTALATIAQAQGAGRLPFPNGTYVTDPALCRQKPDQWTEGRGDSVALMVRSIEGKKLDDGYELFCEVSSVMVSGNAVRFKAKCEAEGEPRIVSGSWVKIDDRSFRIGNRTYTTCGRLIR